MFHSVISLIIIFILQHHGEAKDTQRITPNSRLKSLPSRSSTQKAKLPSTQIPIQYSTEEIKTIKSGERHSIPPLPPQTALPPTQSTLSRKAAAASSPSTPKNNVPMTKRYPAPQPRSSLSPPLQINKIVGHTSPSKEIKLTKHCIFLLKIGLGKVPFDPCTFEFKVGCIERQPYSGNIFKHLINKTLETCCRGRLRKINFTKTLDIDKEESNADFIYPVLSNTNSETVYGHHFIPLITPPGAFYVTQKPKCNLKELVWACFRLWPLLVVCIAMSAIAGFFAWLFETKRNGEEFPRSFFMGWFEGTWWSFISMTTVGYGDKVPRSVVGRLFSVVWILAGIIVFNILAGELTTVILQAKVVGEPVMAEKKVGTLDRLYEHSIVTRSGGELVWTPSEDGVDEWTQFCYLVSDLESGEIDGFLIDKYTYRYFKDMLKQRKYSLEQDQYNDDYQHPNDEEKHGMESSLIEFFFQNTVITSINHVEEDLSYGVLVKNELLYKYFAPTFESNSLAFRSIISSKFRSSKEVRKSESGFQVSVLLYHGALMVIFGLLLAIACFGAIFQLHKCWRKPNKTNSMMP